jgi:hypothetical protein
MNEWLIFVFKELFQMIFYWFFSLLDAINYMKTFIDAHYQCKVQSSIIQKYKWQIGNIFMRL